jgi:hypothetical protein
MTGAVYEIMSKNMVELGRPKKKKKGRCNVTHERCMLDNQGYMRARFCTLPRARTLSHPHSQANL